MTARHEGVDIAGDRWRLRQGHTKPDHVVLEVEERVTGENGVTHVSMVSSLMLDPAGAKAFLTAYVQTLAAAEAEAGR